MNRLISLQITDSVYRLTMLPMVSADNIEAVDSESKICIKIEPVDSLNNSGQIYIQPLTH